MTTSMRDDGAGHTGSVAARIAIAWLAFSLCGCSSAATPSAAPPLDGGSESTSPTIAEYCSARAKMENAWCAYDARCCTAADIADPDYIRILCSPTRADDCTQRVNEVIAAGSIVYHPEHAQACVDAAAAIVPAPPSTCSGMRGTQLVEQLHRIPRVVQLPECRAAFEGTRKAGEPCEYELDCAPPNRCENVATDPRSLDFRCAPVVARGGHCELDDSCEDDLQCAGPFNAKSCTTLLADGAPCGLDGDCLPGHVCAFVGAVDVCVTPGAPGDPCGAANGYQCTLLARCDYRSQRCVALKAIGDPCTDTAECQGRCDPTTKTCVATCGGTR
jgi:hypothetical protein